MGISQINLDNVEIRLAQDETDIKAAQRLRYRVFYEEYDAIPDAEMTRQRRDIDQFDAVADHLIVIDNNIADPEDRIVGTYRLLRHETARRHGRFYTSDEYNIDALLDNGENLLELGRSCVLADYRTRPVLQLLWDGIVNFMTTHEIETLFGCASFHTTDVSAISHQLAYLYHHHLAKPSHRVKALESRYVDMNMHRQEELNPKIHFMALPPLIKGYLRVGCSVGDGAVIDEQFGTTDVCIILPLKEASQRYKNHYDRKMRLSSEAAARQAKDPVG